MGSKEITEAVFDCVNDVSLSVASIDDDLEVRTKLYAVYESSMPSSMAGYCFGALEPGEIESDYRSKYLERFKKTEST